MPLADLRDRLQSALGDAYRIERELTPGGMSRLFLATERSLDRQVVIKLLPPEYASEVSVARFQREVTLTAHLQHPHILPIHAAGSKDGLLYYVMPYVEGESLRQRLQREGKLAVAAAVQVLREVADALARAHEAGVVHRDIKPENILLQRDHALLADFGVARALHEATGGARLTDTGTGLGTPGYMAPEQLAGDQNIDARADVYALAVVGYEMLAGVPPFTGPTPQAVAAAHFTSAPKPLAQLRPDVPRPVSDAIAKAMAKEPDRRFASAADFRDAVAATPTLPGALAGVSRRALAGVTAGLLVIAAASVVVVWRARAHRPQGPPLLAVLPFESAGDTTGREFADGMSEEITTRLSHVAGMSVIARTSALQYRTSGQSAPNFGRRLGVDYVLDGTVRWASAPGGGKRVRITPTLVRVGDGTQVWGEPYEGVPTDVFQLQSDVAEHVATALRLTLLPAERTAVRTAPTEDLDAYRLYLLGREEWRKRTPAGLQNAVADFDQAIARDPKFARAYAGLADAYSLFGEYFVPSVPRNVAYQRARAAVTHALALDPTLAEAHAALGHLLEDADWDWAGAGRELRRAIELDPNYATAHQWYGTLLAKRGQLDSGVVECGRAVRLDPLSGIIAGNYAVLLNDSGRRDEAIAVERAALSRDSTSLGLATDLYAFYLEAGQPAQALAVLSSVGDTSSVLRDVAQAKDDPAIRRRAIGRVRPFTAFGNVGQAWLFAVMNAPDSALAALNRAAAGHDELAWGMIDPAFSSLRADLRFAAIRRAMGLPPLPPVTRQ